MSIDNEWTLEAQLLLGRRDGLADTGVWYCILLVFLLLFASRGARGCFGNGGEIVRLPGGDGCWSGTAHSMVPSIVFKEGALGLDTGVDRRRWRHGEDGWFFWLLSLCRRWAPTCVRLYVGTMATEKIARSTMTQPNKESNSTIVAEDHSISVVGS